MGVPIIGTLKSVEKFTLNWKIAQAKSKLRGKPPTRVSPKKQSTGLFFHPFLRFMRQKSSAFCGKRQVLRPLTPPPFEKGGRKLLHLYNLLCV